MRHSLPSTLALVLALAFALAPRPAAAEQSVEECVAAKLEAAGDLCEDLLQLSGEPIFNHWFFAWYHEIWRAHQIARAEGRFADAWDETEVEPLPGGRQCSESSGTAADAQTLVEDSVDLLSAGFASDTLIDRLRSRIQLNLTGRLCGDLLAAEAEHLRNRFDDRHREGLADDQGAATTQFEYAFGQIEWLLGASDPGADDLAPAVAAVSVDAVGTIAVSPEVSPEWTMVEPPAVVDYEGRELTPTCWDGDPWVYFVKRGTENKLLMYYQGGGACWSGLTCNGLPPIVGPTFKQGTGPGDNPSNFPVGFNDDSNPDNPFADWHAVFVPYCTGDVHWGDAVVEYDTIGGGPITVRHKGFHNAQVAEKFAREHFVHPEQVFVTGSSAGAYGAIVNSLYLQEIAFPSADFAVVGDAGNGVITDDFLAEDLANWGIQDNLPTWMPGLNVPLTELQASDLYIEAAATYPQNRFATYTAAYDGGQGGQTGFFQVMKNEELVLQWARWWDSSCEWNEEMLALNEDAFALAPDNFRYYVGTGSAHTMWGRSLVYTDTTGGVPTIRDWLVAMLEETPDWVNVVADDFGLLLPGNPTPNLALPPYTPFDLDEGRIICD